MDHGDGAGREGKAGNRKDVNATRSEPARCTGEEVLTEWSEVELVRPIDCTEFCANCTACVATSEEKIKLCLLSSNLVEIGICDRERIKVGELMQEANERKKPLYSNIL